MFKKMYKYELAWNKFAKWFYSNLFHLYIKNTLKSLTEKEGLMVLLLMPFFFYDKEIIIDVYPSPSFKKPWTFNIYDKDFEKIFLIKPDEILLYHFNLPKEAYIEACEKAFKILNNELKK